MNPQRPSKVRKVITAVTIAASLALGGVGYAQWVHPNLFPKNFGVVAEGKLYRSGNLTAMATRSVIREHGIKTIVDLGAYDTRPELEIEAQKVADEMGVERRVFRLSGDGTGNPNAYVEALRIITDPSKHPVLVHCAAGSERTGVCIMLYRELVENKPTGSTMHETLTFGHDPDKNQKMAPYLAQWRESIAQAFRNGKSIEGQPAAEIVSPAKSAGK